MVEDRVATLTLNRPDVMNALDAHDAREVTAAVAAAPERARVLVLTGAGRAFCAGQDLASRRRTPTSRRRCATSTSRC